MDRIIEEKFDCVKTVYTRQKKRASHNGKKQERDREKERKYRKRYFNKKLKT